jgi:hypothetical protein
MKRAYNVHQIRQFRPTTLDFDGAWLAAIGKPERTGSWLIWGKSANGKTRFALQLARYLTNFGRVAYNSLEEGLSLTMQNAIAEVGFSDGKAKRNFNLLDKEPIEELRERLKKEKAPKMIIVDSVQYTGMTYTDYKQLRDENPGKLFIFISHADGSEPKGNVANSIKFDANVKIYVEGYRAMPQSRYGGGEHYDVWPLKSAEYWANR